MMMTVIHIGILKKNNNAGTFLRIGYTAVLILVMTFSSKVDSGDYLVCTVGLILFDVALMTENILAAVIFGYSVLCWGIAQPAILNRCHLVLYKLPCIGTHPQSRVLYCAAAGGLFTDAGEGRGGPTEACGLRAPQGVIEVVLLCVRQRNMVQLPHQARRVPRVRHQYQRANSIVEALHARVVQTLARCVIYQSLGSAPARATVSSVQGSAHRCTSGSTGEYPRQGSAC